MPLEVVECPRCGAPLSQVTIEVLAPTCLSCGSVFKFDGGRLGITAAHDSNAGELDRQLLEADLAVCQEHRAKLQGRVLNIEAQLGWPSERYAKMPPPPSLARVQPIPNLLAASFRGAVAAGAALIIGGVISSIFGWLVPFSWRSSGVLQAVLIGLLACWALIVLGLLFSGPFVWIGIRRLNGNLPQKNEALLKQHAAACERALAQAEISKAQQDDLLRRQLRELEASIRTSDEKAAQVRRLLSERYS